MNVKLRKLPYPFKAALTICSDVDGTSFSNFIQIHKFLNTKQNTSIGTGLDLPIGDSFWMYDRPDIADHAFSYFDDLDGNPSEEAPLIRDFIRAGIIDVLHGYGNFAKITDFSRQLAEHTFEELDRHGLKLSVWTNHGGIESAQNIGEKSVGQGDIPDSDFYHSDLLIDNGIKFFWDSEISLMTNVGQDCEASFGDAYWRTPIYENRKLRAKSKLKGYITLSDKLFHKFTNKHFIHWEAFNSKENDLISLDKLRDGNEMYRFKRLGLGRYDWSDDLSMLLNDNVVETLICKKGYLILYIHLGDRKNKHDSSPLSEQSIQTLRNLSELYHDGILWLTTTSRLLNYNLLTKSILWTIQESDESVKIYLKGDPSNLKNHHFNSQNLGGLTFYVPEKKNIEIFAQGKPLVFKKNQKDSTGQESISIPIPSLEWPL